MCIRDSVVGKQVIDWQKNLEQKWSALHFGDMKIDTHDNQHFFEVKVFLNDIDPRSVRVELYAEGVKGEAPFREEMKQVSSLPDTIGGFVYGVKVSGGRPPTDYTARVIPHHDGVAAVSYTHLDVYKRQPPGFRTRLKIMRWRRQHRKPKLNRNRLLWRSM